MALQGSAETPQPGRPEAADEHRHPKDGEDPGQDQLPLGRDPVEGKLRREGIRNTQRDGQAAKYEDALHARHCQPKAGPEEPPQTSDG